MIGVRLEGRLGNQMFQYALALACSRRMQTAFFVDQIKWNFLLPRYFVLPHYHRWLNSLRTRAYHSFLKNNFTVLKEGENFSIKNLDAVSGKVYFDGYFQSEKYFENYRELITKEFEIKPLWRKAFEDKYGNFFKSSKTVAVHVRKTDYTSWDLFNNKPQDLSLPDSYFLKCLKSIENTEQYKILFVSDDIEYCRKAFGNLQGAMFESNEMIIDFQILTHADICIISHSSFSWWAAYLNAKPHKRILAPKNWLGFKVGKEIPEAVMSVNWDWRDVE